METKEIEETKPVNHEWQLIGIFNLKGGVGKTTTSCSLGWKLAEEGKRVLLVDADPQCNLTGFLVDPGFDMIPKEHRPDKDALELFYERYPLTNMRAAFAGLLGTDELKSSLGLRNTASSLTTECFQVQRRNELLPTGQQRFTQPPENLYLLAGHPDFHEYDDQIRGAMVNVTSSPAAPNIPGAFYHLFQGMAQRYRFDYVIVDMNPSQSIVNKLLVMSCNQLIIPCSCDYYSLMGVKSIARLLPEWDNLKEEQWRGSSYRANALMKMPSHKPMFIGHTFQLRHSASSCKYWIDRINKEVNDTLVPALARRGMVTTSITGGSVSTGSLLPQPFLDIGRFCDYQNGAAFADTAHIPVWKLTSDLCESTQVISEIVPNIMASVVQLSKYVQTRFSSLPVDTRREILLTQQACNLLQYRRGLNDLLVRIPNATAVDVIRVAATLFRLPLPPNYHLPVESSQ